MGKEFEHLESFISKYEKIVEERLTEDYFYTQVFNIDEQLELLDFFKTLGKAYADNPDSMIKEIDKYTKRWSNVFRNAYIKSAEAYKLEEEEVLMYK